MRVVVMLLVSLAATGCATAVGVAAGGAAVGVVTGRAVAGRAAAGTAVAVTFDPPRNLAAVGRVPGDSVLVRGAVSLVGRVTGEHGDTMDVALSEARGAGGPVTFPTRRPPAASVVRGEGVSVRVINRRPDLTDGMFIGAVAGAAAAFLALMAICASTGCLD